MTSLPVPDVSADVRPRRISRKPTGGDAVFAHTFRAIGASVLVITGGIGVFLAYQAIPTLRHYGAGFFPETQGVLDDYFECWFLTEPHAIAAPMEGLEKTYPLGQSQDWLAPPDRKVP